MQEDNSDTVHSILLVEDDDQLRLLLEESLGAAGYEVDSAENVSSARTAIQTRAYDLLIVDMRLPDGNGLDLTQEVRKVSQTAIIVITGAGDEVDRILGLELGADDFIQKPFFNRELIARAKAVLRRYDASRAALSTMPADPQDSCIAFHGYTIHFGSRTLQSDCGNAVNLTTSEFDVLAHLAKNRNLVLSRDDIYAAARLRSGDPGRLIDGLVLRLRRKLYCAQSAKQKIRTVHGRGYVLSDTA